MTPWSSSLQPCHCHRLVSDGTQGSLQWSTLASVTVCFPSWTQNSTLQCNMTHTLISVPFEKTCYHGGDLPATWQKWCSLLHYCLLVTPCSLVDKHQTFTETFASISAVDRCSRLICNGASLPDYTALQLATQWLSSSSSSVWIHWGPKQHHLELHFDTDACEQVNYFPC